MRLDNVCRWLKRGTLAVVLLGGCRSADQPCASCASAYTSTVVFPPDAVARLPIATDTTAVAAVDGEPLIVRVGSKEIQPETPPPSKNVGPVFSHNAEYTSLSGELRFLEARASWTLRYAARSEGDRYGGSVTLTDLGSMNSFHTGQRIRVVGSLVDATSHEPSPAFHVETITPLPTP